MRHLMPCVTGLALLLGCTGSDGLPTDAGPVATRAGMIRTNVGFSITGPGSPLFVMVGFAAGVTLEDAFCSGVSPEVSPNSIAHGVLPPSGAFLGSVHGRDVPVRVYQFDGDICDGVGERLIASGTARFHSSDKQHRDGRVIQNAGVRGVLDLVAGGRALLAVRSPFYVLPDGSVKFDKTKIELTPL